MRLEIAIAIAIAIVIVVEICMLAIGPAVQGQVEIVVVIIVDDFRALALGLWVVVMSGRGIARATVARPILAWCTFA